MMRDLVEWSEVVNRAEEKIYRVLEAHDDRCITDLLEEIINFPIHEKNGLALLEDILTTADNKVKLVGLFNFFCFSHCSRLRFSFVKIFLDPSSP